jgi:hypothetical protein
MSSGKEGKKSVVISALGSATSAAVGAIGKTVGSLCGAMKKGQQGKYP